MGGKYIKHEGLYSMSDVRAEEITLIHSELKEFSEKLRGYVALCDEVRWAERNMPSEINAFTDDKKTRLVDCLKKAAVFKAGNVIAPDNITIKLARVLARLEETAAYVEPARAPTVTPVVEEAKRVSKIEGKLYKVLRRWSEMREEGPVLNGYYWEERMYSEDDPDGQYQVWCNNKRIRKFVPDEDYIAKYVPNVDLSQAVKIETLLDALNTLKI